MGNPGGFPMAGGGIYTTLGHIYPPHGDQWIPPHRGGVQGQRPRSWLYRGGAPLYSQDMGLQEDLDPGIKRKDLGNYQACGEGGTPPLGGGDRLPVLA